MTTVSSSPLALGQPKRLPLEVLFRAKTFLDRWLDPWSAERALANGYRVLMLDVAGCHLPDEVSTFCWSRGYFALFHYGCTTGVAQVNGTDLHGVFERKYLEVEQASFVEQQLYAPGLRAALRNRCSTMWLSHGGSSITMPSASAISGPV